MYRRLVLAACVLALLAGGCYLVAAVNAIREAQEEWA